MQSLNKVILSHEHTDILPVDTFYDLALAKLIQTHEKLDALPKNPFGDNTPTLVGLKNELGIIDNTDFSMFLMGGMQQMAIGAVAGTLGLSSAFSQAIDFGTSMMAEARNNNEAKPEQPRTKFKKAANDKQHTSMFRAAFKRAQEPAKKPAMPATNIMRRAMQQKQMAAYKKALKQRRALERQLVDLKEKIHLLNVYKKQDISYVKMSADGKMLTPLNGKPRFVYEMERKKNDNRLAYERQFNAPAPRLAA